jgi:hypothetical protein
MKNKTRSLLPATYPLTIGTPYGDVKVLLRVCESGDHFSFLLAESSVALSTRAAEPFLYRLSQVLPAIGEAMWMELPPHDLRQEIESGTYQPSPLNTTKDSN